MTSDTTFRVYLILCRSSQFRNSPGAFEAATSLCSDERTVYISVQIRSNKIEPRPKETLQTRNAAIQEQGYNEVRTFEDIFMDSRKLSEILHDQRYGRATSVVASEEQVQHIVDDLYLGHELSVLIRICEQIRQNVLVGRSHLLLHVLLPLLHDCPDLLPNRIRGSHGTIEAGSREVQINREHPFEEYVEVGKEPGDEIWFGDAHEESASELERVVFYGRVGFHFPSTFKALLTGQNSLIIFLYIYIKNIGPICTRENSNYGR